MGPKTRFHSRLEALVKAEIETRGASIICGELLDYPAYMAATGYIRGLQDALRLCEDIERDLSQ